MKYFIIVAAVTSFVFSSVVAQDAKPEVDEENTEVSYSELRAMIDGNEIEGATISGYGWWVTVKTKTGSKHHIHVTPDTPIADRLVDAGIPTKFRYEPDDEEEDELPLFLSLFFNILPLLIFLVFFFFVMRLMNSKKKNDEFFERLEEIIKRSRV